MIHPITITMKVAINQCNWENSIPSEFEYCDFEFQLAKASEIAKRISKGSLKLSEEEWSNLTDQIIRNLIE